MTPSHQAELEQVAREWLIKQTIARLRMVGFAQEWEPLQEHVDALVTLLAATRRAALEEAASTHFNYCAVSNEEETPDYQICTCDVAEFREWCRQQAKEVS